MRENDVRENVLVYHRERGVGHITAIEAGGQSLLIQFGNQARHRMSREIALGSLERLPDDGLEATLLNNPEVAQGWVRNGPLRLVAAALADAGGVAKPKDLQMRLQRRALGDVKWTTWWKRIQPLVKQSPHFRVGHGLYTLIGNAGDVPEEKYSSPPRHIIASEQLPQKRKSASPQEWVRWLLGSRDITPPGNVPSQVVLDVLDVLPSEMLERAFQRLLSGLRIVLDGKRTPAAQSLAVWMEAITRLTSRSGEDWPGLGQSLPGSLVESATELLAQSRHKTFARKFATLLIPIVQKGGVGAQAVVRNLIVAVGSKSTAALELLHELCDSLSEPARGSFLKAIAREVFQTGSPEHQKLVLDTVDERDRDYVLAYLPVLVIDGQVSADILVQALRKEWLPAQEAKRKASLKSLLLATMILGDAAESIHPLVTDGFRSAIREQGNTVADPVVSLLVNTAREEISRTRYELEQRLRSEVEAVSVQLLEKEREAGRARSTVVDLEREIGRQREQAKLEIRRDMLLAIGEVLQILSTRDRTSTQLASDVRAGLSLALRAGGAEILGRLGEAVSYDPRLHQSDKPLNEGAAVVVTAPGVRVGTEHLGNLVLLKAHVAEEGAGEP